MPSENRPSFHLRLRPELRKRIKIAAAANDRSITAEITARLERSFSDDSEDRQKALKLLAEAMALLDKGEQE